ncbi:MAG: prepilin-type N-terminal cleavage/methylation domain-containing protein [Kangiellaceae bacterium]|nr:prepilin-type N-terminal cleavage/methylation domain-containing protein [Kangiellaceae bacterium]
MKKNVGFSLIELMIAIAIIGIISAIAYPSYISHIKKGKRSDAMSSLLSAAEAIERYKANNFTYAGATLGSGGIHTDRVPVQGSGIDYELSFSNLTATTYTITASPKGGMTGDCTLTINQAGVKGTTTTSSCSSVDNW